VALILKRNGAPLSGALFVKNPRRRRRIRRLNRAQRRSLKFRTLAGLGTVKMNRRRRRVRKNGLAIKANGRKSGLLSRLLAKFKRRRKNTGYRLNRRRNGMRRNVHRAVRHNRRHRMKRVSLAALLSRAKHNRRRRRRNPMKSFRTRKGTVSFFAKKNAGYMLNRRRRRVRKNAGYQLNRRHSRRHNRGVRRNPSFEFGALAPVKRLTAKFPVVGPVVASSLGYLAFGAGALATHYYGMKAVRYVGGMLPAPVQKVGDFVAPVGYSLLGIAANVALTKLPIPTVGFVTPEFRKNLGHAALLVGAAIDLWRFFQGKSSDLGDADDYGDDYGVGYDLGDGGAYDVVGLGGIGVYGAAQCPSEYSDAEMADAYYSGPDLDGTEGEAALSGMHAYRAAFGAPAKVASRKSSAVSRHAGKRGHRWAWLIKLIGFDRFQQVAALPPEERCALIAELRKQAIATVNAKFAGQQQQAAMSGIGASGLGAIGVNAMAGIGASDMSGIGETGVADYGVMMAGSAY
jgi:hypothetical protein